jgi:hypothetical protein
MRAYLVASGRVIQPFGDPVADSMIGNLSLREHQAAVLREAGLELVRVDRPDEIPPGRHLVTRDDVYFTRRVLVSLLELARAQPGSLRAGLPAESLLVRRTAPLQDLEQAEVEGEALVLYRLGILEVERPPVALSGLDALFAAARPVRARFREKLLEVPTPKNITGSASFRHPLTSSIVLHVRHWVHVLWANQLSIQVRWVETILDHKLWSAGRLIAGALRGGLAGLARGRLEPARLKWGAFARMNVIGKGCDIHPTAHLEGVQLGDGVRVGAYTLIRGSLVGSGTSIEDRANVIFSVIGPGSFMSKNASMTLCAGYPEADLSIRGVQCCLFGRRVAMTSGARVIDMKVKGEIQVLDEGRPVSAGTNFLGACFGHGAFAGADVIVQAGRAVPNGAVLVRPPGDIFRDIPADLPPGEPAWAVDGRAVTRRGRKQD